MMGSEFEFTIKLEDDEEFSDNIVRFKYTWRPIHPILPLEYI